MIYDSRKLYKAIIGISTSIEYSCVGGTYEGITWHKGTQPTEEEIVRKIAELEYQEEVEVYKEQRAAEYPSYADQFDKIFHEGVDAWKADIQAIKDKYPKQTMDAAVLEERQNQAVIDITPQSVIDSINN